MMTYVYVGAGGLGCKLALLVPPVAFADRNPERWHEGDTPCLSIEDAVKRYRAATFVVTIWGGWSTHRIEETERILNAMGVATMPFGEILRAANASHYWVAPRDDVLADEAAHERASSLWTDALSQSTYASNRTARLNARPSRCAFPVRRPAYWRERLIRFDPSTEHVLDGGAFDGDSYRAFVDHFGMQPERWDFVEPDPVTFQRLMEATSGQGNNMGWHRVALGAASGRVPFNTTGTPDSAVGLGRDSVHQITIDAMYHGAQRVTYIKLDIEGSERAALTGAWKTIARDRPVLGVCVYHRPTDLWTLPALIQEHVEDYRFYLRAHGAEGWDVICYAVPKERAQSDDL